jgi:hypothetical protein
MFSSFPLGKWPIASSQKNYAATTAAAIPNIATWRHV